MKKQYTKYTKKIDLKRNWYTVDAKDKTLGRLTSDIAKQLMGKNNVNYTPSVDTGDFIIVINADKVKLTGKKENQKVYYRHSNYPGGLKETSFKVMLEKKPEELIRIAVKGMLPKNRLGRQMINKLKIYRGTESKHSAQDAKPLVFK